MILKEENQELKNKLISGINKAFDKLVAEKAAKDQTLIIGDQHGNFKEVPAKELLLSTPKQDK